MTEIFSEKALTEKARYHRMNFRDERVINHKTIEYDYKSGYWQCKEDLRAWLKKEANIAGGCEKDAKKREHKRGMAFWDGYKTAIRYLDCQFGFKKELLAELSKTGGLGATREKPPPRSFL